MENKQKEIEDKYGLKKEFQKRSLVLRTSFETKNAISNMDKIVDIIDAYIDFLHKLNIYTGEKENKNNSVIDIDLEIKKILKKDFKINFEKQYIENKYDEYINKLSIYLESLVDDAIYWLEKEDYGMYASVLADVKDILEISHFFYTDFPAKAHDKLDHLDTYIRDGIDNELWNEFVLGNDIEHLQHYEKSKEAKEKLEKELSSSDIKTNKLKI